MTAVQILQAIIEILYGALTQGAEKLGTGISAMVKSMFFEVSEAGAITALNPFGMIVCIFAGIALTVGIGRLIYNLLSRFGAR